MLTEKGGSSNYYTYTGKKVSYLYFTVDTNYLRNEEPLVTGCSIGYEKLSVIKERKEGRQYIHVDGSPRTEEK